MNLAQPRVDQYYSREEFRRWCEAQTKGRYERLDGRIVAMAPERGAHLGQRPARRHQDQALHQQLPQQFSSSSSFAKALLPGLR